MSRRSRLKLDGIPIHIRKPGNNRNACFYADEDYQLGRVGSLSVVS